MKAFRITMKEKNGTHVSKMYHIAENEEAAVEYFNNNFNRFNTLESVKDISNTKKGKDLISK